MKNYTTEELRARIPIWNGLHTNPNRWYIEKDFDERIPDTFWQLEELTQIEELHIHYCNLTELPEEIPMLPGLQTLCFANNLLTRIPDYRNSLQNLRSVKFSYNKFEHFPDHLLALSDLRGLDLENNLIRNIPEDIFKYGNYPHLTLNGNPIENVPAEIILENKNKVFFYFIQRAVYNNPKYIEAVHRVDERFRYMVFDFLSYFNQYIKLYHGRTDLFVPVKEHPEGVAFEFPTTFTDGQINDLQEIYEEYRMLVLLPPEQISEKAKFYTENLNKYEMMLTNTVLQSKLSTVQNDLRTALALLSIQEDKFTKMSDEVNLMRNKLDLELPHLYNKSRYTLPSVTIINSPGATISIQGSGAGSEELQQMVADLILLLSEQSLQKDELLLKIIEAGETARLDHFTPESKRSLAQALSAAADSSSVVANAPAVMNLIGSLLKILS